MSPNMTKQAKQSTPSNIAINYIPVKPGKFAMA